MAAARWVPRPSALSRSHRDHSFPMADQDSDAPTPETTTSTPAPATVVTRPAASSQNLILGIVLGAIFLFFVLFMLSNGSQGFGLGQKQPAEDPALAEIREELAAAKASRDAARDAILAPSTMDGNALISNIKQDADSLANVLAGYQTELARLQGIETASQQAFVQVADLQNQLRQAQGAAGQLAAVQNQLQQANQTIQRLNQQLAQSADPSQVTELRQQLQGTRKEREDLRTQYAELRARVAGMVDRSELDKLQEIQVENRRLRAELQELRARLDKTLFVTRDNLAPLASKLFAELVALEGSTEDQRKAAYQEIKTTLNARVMETADFATGSAALDSEHESHIENVIAASPDNCFFLVVGYASKTGDSQANRELSRRRATRTASVVNYLKRQTQKVQAVYLGETDRFGPNTSKNQVCEVWEIHR